MRREEGREREVRDVEGGGPGAGGWRWRMSGRENW